MTSLSENTVVTTSGGNVELAYAQMNNPPVTLGTAAVTLTNGPISVVCDGSPITIDFNSIFTIASGNQVNISLYKDGSLLNQYWAYMYNGYAAGIGLYYPIQQTYRDTPTAGIHTYEIRAFMSNTNASPTNTANVGTFTQISKVIQASQFIVPLASAPLVTSLPSTGNIDGQEVRYLVDDASGTIWNLRWRASANRWEPISGFESDRNRIINGAMLVDERRRNSAANSQTDVFVADRFRFYALGGGNANVQTLNNDGPSGVSTNSARITVATQDTSLSSGDYYFIRQAIEGYLVQDFEFGSASVNKEITLSFYVKSSVTGTFGGSIKNNALNRSYTFSYTINSANTWERKIITFTNDKSGTWEKTTNAGLLINWGLGHGSGFISTGINAWESGNFNQPSGCVNLFNTAAATWQLSGVQVELGPTATPFQQRSFEQELNKCQRYFLRHDAFTYFDGASGNSTVARGAVQFPSTMRAAPTVVTYPGQGLTGTANQVYVSNTNSAASISTPTAYIDGFDTIGNPSNLPGAYLYGFSYTATAEIS